MNAFPSRQPADTRGSSQHVRTRPGPKQSRWLSVTGMAAAVLGLLAMILSVRAAKKMDPVASPLCAPTNAQGGMFGYSVSTVTVGNWTWLAVGQPWSSSVHLYRTPFTQVTVTVVNVTSAVTVCQNGTSTFTLAPSTTPTSTASTTSTLLSTSASANSTATTTTTGANLQCATTTSTKQNVQFSHNLTTPVTWTLITTLTDPLESSSTGGRPWDGTKDASGRSLFGYDISLSPDASWLAIGTPGRSFTAFTNLTLPHVSWHPYHGSVVMYQVNTNTSAVTYHSELRLNQLPGMSQRYFDRFGSKVRFSPDTQADRVHLFASANGAWDGVSAPGGVKANGVRPVYGQDVDAGWPVFPTTTSENQGVGVFRFTTASNTWQPIQFLRARSPVPLGTLGIDFAVSGTGARDTVLAVRDYDVTLTPGIVNDTSSGMVVIYRQDVNQFTESARIVGNRLGLGSLIRQEDWFGVGLSLAVADDAQQAVLHVGAPRAGKVFRLLTKRVGIWDTWAVDGPARANPAAVVVPRHSFYGGTLASARTGRVLFASDAAGANGRGTVYLMHRRVAGWAVGGFEDVLRDSTASSNATFEYDWIGTMNAPTSGAGSSASQAGVYAADHFGKAVASSGNVVVVGAPVGECLYTYSVPVSYPIPGWVSDVFLPNNTITADPRPTLPPDANNRVSEDKTILYAIIGSVAGVLLFVPLAIYTAMHFHKKKLMAQLAANKAAQSSTSPLTAGL